MVSNIIIFYQNIYYEKDRRQRVKKNIKESNKIMFIGRILICKDK